MKFQTLSFVAGTRFCPAQCPFCVSKMTGEGLGQAQVIHSRNAQKALDLASAGGVTTVIITGKGEPTLYPNQITEFLHMASPKRFPFIELQSMGHIFTQERFKDYDVDELIHRWYELGLTTVMISNVGPDPELNSRIYFGGKKPWIDVEAVIDRLHTHGLMARLTTIGIAGGIDSYEKVDQLVDWAKAIGADQLSFRPVSKPEVSEDQETLKWVEENRLASDTNRLLTLHLKANGAVPLFRLVHNAVVYDYRGMNICLTSCLTHDSTDETIRQLILFPNGELYTDWQFKGSRLL